MALRLEANLMVGVAIVYKKQADFLYADINHVLINFKKKLSSMQNQDVNLLVTEARTDAITLGPGELNESLEDFPIFKTPAPRSTQDTNRSILSMIECNLN
jgi:hypothetical protein